MKVAHRIGTGFALLIVMLVAVLGYHTWLIRSLAAVTRDLSASKLRAAQLAAELQPLLAQQRNLVRKLLELRDPDYAAKLKATNEEVGLMVAELATLETGPDERLEIARLARAWLGDQPQALPALGDVALPEAEAQPEESLPRLTRVGADHETAALLHLRRLSEQTEAMARATETAVAAQRERARRVAERAGQVGLAGIAASVLLSLLVGLVTIRSINQPLRRLIEATRAVAGGRFARTPDAGRSDELGQAAAAFNAMTRSLEALDRMKKDFVARVSHDLRTPLVAMQETNELLLTELSGPLNDEQLRLVELNQQSARRLAGRIGTLLDLARMEAGALALDCKEHDLGALVRLALEETEGRRRQRRLRLDLHLPAGTLGVWCDFERLLQVLENLLDNAIKFAPSDSRLAVEAQARDTPPEHLPAALAARFVGAPGLAQVTVADQGPGLADRDKARVFRSFFRAGGGDDDRGPRGAGLGLAICRDLVEAHRGAIWVTDNPGGGSCFHVLLPRVAPS